MTSRLPASEKDIDVAVAAARKAFKTTWGKNVTGFERSRLLNKLADLIERDAQELAELESLNKLIGEDTCAVIVEPVQGEGGIHAVSTEWLRAVRKRCDEVGAVLIFDEIQVRLYFDCYRTEFPSLLMV